MVLLPIDKGLDIPGETLYAADVFLTPGRGHDRYDTDRTEAYTMFDAEPSDDRQWSSDR